MTRLIRLTVLVLALIVPETKLAADEAKPTPSSDAQALQDVLKDFPNNCIKAEVIGERKIVRQVDHRVTIRVNVLFRVDESAFDAFRASLLTVLGRMANSTDYQWTFVDRNGTYYAEDAQAPQVSNPRATILLVNTPGNGVSTKLDWKAFALDSTLEAILARAARRQGQCKLTAMDKRGATVATDEFPCVLHENFNLSLFQRSIPHGLDPIAYAVSDTFLYLQLHYVTPASHRPTITVSRDIEMAETHLQRLEKVACELRFTDPDSDDAIVVRPATESPLVAPVQTILPPQPAPGPNRDGGVTCVETAAVLPGPRFQEGKTAEEQLNDYIAVNGWKLNWDEKHRRFLAMSTVPISTDDPRYDRNFYLNRDIAAREALLEAKAKIIRFIHSEMSAMEQMRCPGTDLNAQLGPSYEEAENKLDAQRQDVAELLKAYDAAQAAALEGATTMDRVRALMDAAIERLDREYSLDSVEKRKTEKFENIKARYQEGLTKLAELEREAKKRKDQVTSEFTSEFTVVAKSPLVGATAIQQAESWDGKNYQLAVLACWSVALERAALAAMTGESVVDQSKIEKKQTVEEWLAEQDLGAMIGPRQYLDPSGQRYFLGICARPVSRNAAVDHQNRALADVWARQTAVFSLFCDVDAYQSAKMLARETNTGRDSVLKSAETLEQSVRQSCKDLVIQGLAPMVEKVVKHPLTDQKIHVCVYGISPESARAAMKIERASALGALAVHKAQQLRRGKRTIGGGAEQPAGQPAGLQPSEEKEKGKRGSVLGGKVDKEF